MLLLVALTLKGAISITPTPPVPPPPSTGGGGGGGKYRTEQVDRDREIKDRILRDDSDIVAIVELTLKTVII
jgi:hypothetical protein